MASPVCGYSSLPPKDKARIYEDVETLDGWKGTYLGRGMGSPRQSAGIISERFHTAASEIQIINPRALSMIYEKGGEECLVGAGQVPVRFD